MQVFICHSRRDDAGVQPLADRMRHAGVTVLMEQSQDRRRKATWSGVLDQIRSCTVFTVALTDQCLQSKPCQAQLNYARALGLPMLSVQIDHVTRYRIDPTSIRQSVDFRHPDVASGMAVMEALHTLAAQRTALPDPLPEPPPIPSGYLFGYVSGFAAQVESAEQLSPAAQSQLIYELRGALDDEEDDAVRDDIRRVLRMLSARPDLTHRSTIEVNALLQTPAWPPRPPTVLPPNLPSAPAPPTVRPPFVPYGSPTPPAESKPRWWRRKR